MYQDNIVLCGASSYEQKYYFNQDFASLPETVKQEMQIHDFLQHNILLIPAVPGIFQELA